MSEKSKRKVQPKRFTRLQKVGIAVIIYLLFMLFVMSWQSHRNFEPPAPNPNFELTVTQIIADATATQISALATQTAFYTDVEGCEIIELKYWSIYIEFDSENEIDRERSLRAYQFSKNNWLCDEAYRFEHTEYLANVYVEAEEVDLSLLIDDIALYLQDYLPENNSLSEPMIELSIIQPYVSRIPVGIYRINYNELMEAFDSGLLGAELLDAVATPVE